MLVGRRGASAAMDISASLGHVGLNWTPKRHGTVSPALAERIKVALLCAVRDRKRPYKDKSLALLPNRILIHNIFSYLADVNSVRINGALLLDESPPNGVYARPSATPGAPSDGAPALVQGLEARRVRMVSGGATHALGVTEEGGAVANPEEDGALYSWGGGGAAAWSKSPGRTTPTTCMPSPHRMP